jgi:colanic acid biosynthesis glycosyl transferase WcaI
MRILLLTLNYLPELTGIGKFSGEMAEWLAARGHEVRVVTTPPYYPEWRVHPGFSAWHYARERRANVDVLRCPLWVPRHQGGTARVLNLASFAVSSAPAVVAQALAFRPDVVGVIKPPMFVLPAALLAARLVGASTWVHIQDFEIDVALEMGIIKNSMSTNTAMRIEAAMLRRFDFSTTISARMLQLLIAKGVDEKRTALFPNWVDGEVIRPLPGPSSLRAELGIEPGRMVALYAGNMGEKQGLETLVDAARALRNDSPNILIILAGEGAVRQRLEALAKGLPNLLFLPLQPIERLNQLLNLANIHLLPQRADAADLVMPSKLSGMLASGRPIVAGARLGTQVASEVEGAGLVVPPDDGLAIAAALRRLASDPSLCAALSVEARARALAHWDQETVLARLESQLSGLIQK